MKFVSRKLILTRQQINPAHLLHSVVVITALFTLLPFLSSGQGYIEGANISYEYMPLKIKTPLGDQTFTGNNFKIGSTVPIFLKADRSRYLLAGGNLEAFSFSGTHPEFEVKRVYSISPTFGYSTMISRKFNLTALFMPTMNSDYKNVKGSDIKLGGIVRGSWKVRNNLTWKVTLGYRRQFYGPQYIALVGLDWKVNDKWWIFGDIPHNATVSYSVNEKTNAGFNLFVQPATYRLNNQDRYFEYNTVNPGLFAERYISSGWAIRATAAYTLIRNMEIYNKNDKTDGFIDFYEMGDRKDPINREIESGLVFKVALSFRIVPGKK